MLVFFIWQASGLYDWTLIFSCGCQLKSQKGKILNILPHLPNACFYSAFVLFINIIIIIVFFA